MRDIRDDYHPEKLLRAQLRRQAMLDYLLAHPMATFEAVLEAVMAHQPPLDGVSHMSLRGAVVSMLRKREIAATGHPRERRYVALVSITESAESLRANHLARQKANNAKYDQIRLERKAKEKKPTNSAINTWNGGSIRHEGGTLPQDANQRGQGALRPRVYVNAYHLF